LLRFFSVGGRPPRPDQTRGGRPTTSVCFRAMPDRSRKRPRDPNQLAKVIADIATGAINDAPQDDGKDPAAVALGRRGGLKGGKARAARLTPEERKESAKRAARARWAGKGKDA
jgi:hypothetical protein